MTVYIDSLFFTNLFMDTAIFIIVSAVQKRRVRTRRILLGSVLSAVYGTLIFFPRLSLLYSAAFKLLASAVFVFIAFGRQPVKSYIRALAAFWFISAAAGGIIFLLSSYTNIGTVMKTMLSNGVMYVNISPFLLAGGCVLLYVLAEFYRRSCARKLSTESALLDIEVLYLGRSYKLKGLIDTGCSLTEPLSGAPVIVAESGSFKDIPEDGARLPISTAAGEGTLRLILPDKIRCLSEGYTILPNTAVALTDSRFGGGYNAVINPLAAEAVNNITSINEGTRCRV